MATYRLIDLMYRLENGQVNPQEFLLSEWIEFAKSLKLVSHVSDDRQSAHHQSLYVKVKDLLLNARLITEERFSELTA